MQFTFYLDEAPWQLDDYRPRSGLRAQHIIVLTIGANAAYHHLSQGLLSPRKRASLSSPTIKLISLKGEVHSSTLILGVHFTS